MITYNANYEPVNKPYICKVFTASDDEQVHTALSIGNEAEKAEMSVELIYEHISNVITYIQDRSKTLSVIQYEENLNSEPWPLKGWEDINWANNEISLWWSYIYYKDKSYTANNIVFTEETSSEHTHEDTEDHGHDPETGDPIPNESSGS
jgi:transcription-repair coupling factor (superfamily II helicase)